MTALERELERIRPHSEAKREVGRAFMERTSPIAPALSPEEREQMRTGFAEEQLVVADLHAALIPVVELADLREVRAPYPEAIPVLLEHLDRGHIEGLCLTIVALLAVPFAGSAAFERVHATLHRERDVLPDYMLFHIGNALAKSARRRDLDALIGVVREPRNREARLFPVLRVARSRRPAAADAVLAFFHERPDLWYGSSVWFGTRALRFSKQWSQTAQVEALLQSPDDDVRMEARRYLRAAGVAQGAFRHCDDDAP